MTWNTVEMFHLLAKSDTLELRKCKWTQREACICSCGHRLDKNKTKRSDSNSTGVFMLASSCLAWRIGILSINWTSIIRCTKTQVMSKLMGLIPSSSLEMSTLIISSIARSPPTKQRDGAEKLASTAATTNSRLMTELKWTVSLKLAQN